MIRRITLTLLLLLATLGLAASASMQPKAAQAFTADSDAPAESVVEISDYQFTPKVLVVRAGTTVRWTSKEGAHTVTADNGAFASDTLMAGNSFSYTFTKPGTFRYHCSFHGSVGGGGMSGVIKVRK